MNVLYVDIDGTLDTEENVQVLAEICQKYDCKVVISSGHKPRNSDWEEESPVLVRINEFFKKYNIECLGYTPEVTVKRGSASIAQWKDYEILYHLMNTKNLDIEHFAVIDDNDYKNMLILLKDYLIETTSKVGDHIEVDGLCSKHIEQVGAVLKLKNKFKL